MARTILTDIDGTLADSRWRDGITPWDEYHAMSIQDEPNKHMIWLIKALHEREYVIVGVTTRPEKFRKLTMNWLLKYDVPIDTLLMRPNDDHRPSPELKVDLVAKALGLDDISFILDDREDVIAAFRAKGVDGLHVLSAQ